MPATPGTPLNYGQNQIISMSVIIPEVPLVLVIPEKKRYQILFRLLKHTGGPGSASGHSKHHSALPDGADDDPSDPSAPFLPGAPSIPSFPSGPGAPGSPGDPKPQPQPEKQLMHGYDNI
jgi:hypothetical protein